MNNYYVQLVTDTDPLDHYRYALNESRYEKISELMLYGSHERVDTVQTTGAYAIRGRDYTPKTPICNTDFSFTGQMAQVLRAADDLHGHEVGKPDAIFVTAYSAIPVADAIRGLYETLGEDCPPIVTAKFKHNDAYNYNYWKNPIAEADEAIVGSLADSLGGATHAVIIDQYTIRGDTLNYGGALLHEAGIPHVTGVQGEWYSGADPDEIDTDAVSSPRHARFMHEQGVQAARIIMENARNEL